MRCYNDKHNLYGWYVHISHYHGTDIQALYRGDSDPILMYDGIRINQWDFETYLYRWFDEEIWYAKNDGIDISDNDPVEYMMEMCDGSIYDYFYEYSMVNSSTIRKSKSVKKKRNRMKLTENERAVLDLAKTLEDRSKFIESYKFSGIDEQWDAHNCSTITLSEMCGDYQVLRVYDVEYEPCDPLEYATEEELEKIEKEEEGTGYFDSSFEVLCERVWEDGNDPYHTIEYAEVIQYWINVHTGDVVMLGKMCQDDTYYCDFNAEFEIISLNTKTGNHAKFREHFYNAFGEYHYLDINVHPVLQARGYEPIDAADWYYGCGEDGNRSPENVFIRAISDMNGGLINYIQDAIMGGYTERMMKMYGKDTLVEAYNTKYPEQYLIARKICNRNHYVPDNWELWKDLVNMLVQLEKDLHNAYYVCPVNVKDAHDKYMKMLQNKLQRERRIREQRERELAAERLRKQEERLIGMTAKYAERVAKFKDVLISDDKYDIFVCPTVQDMADESAAMHHCVYACKYYEKEGSLILLCRDKDGNRVVTIEVIMSDWHINQCYAKHDNIHPDDTAIRALVMDNIKLLKKASKPKKETKIIEMKRTEQQPVMAVAA